jgi:alkanesulfonate monooxygenase SsuD/methylene tetrahydromethanopterin reductase-like flavin-dependent oxidoreductase (luciferase family)
MVRVAQTADEVGFDSVWLVDHFHTIPRPSQEVTFEHEYRAYGYDYPDAPERLRRLGEAVQVILAMWTQEEAVFEGTYYQVRGAINQPKGVQKPHIPLLIGGGGEKVTLKLVAQYADACNISGDLKTIKRKFAVLKDHCETVGRDYESIRRTIACLCAIGETDEQARAKIPTALLGRPVAAGALIGSPDTIRHYLAELETIGVQEVILGFPDILQLDSLRFFAQEFMV